METPFVFGRIATGDNFTDRRLETEQLVQQFRSLINTIIISPRRWGKSSLVQRASIQAQKEDPRLRIAHVDLFNIRSEEEFYTALASNVIKATSSRWEEFVNDARSFFSSIVPKISIGAGPENEASLDFDWEEVKHSPDEILDLPERVAKQKNLKLVICIDEFQNIAEFSDSDTLQKKLRSHMQRQQNVAYCLYGSKRHLMLEVFTNTSKPFYKFGNLMFLNKIAQDDLVAFFRQRFEDTHKSITEEAATEIATLTDCHPYYAQQLAQLSWLRTVEVCDSEIVRTAFASLEEQLSLLFINLTEGIKTQQLAYLKAILAGETAITSTEVMKKYGISSATSAIRAKKALIKDDILDAVGNQITFQDPVFRHWLQHSYFGQRRVM